MNRIIGGIGAFLVVVAASLHADDLSNIKIDSQPFPGGPVLNLAPGFSRWTVSVSLPKAEASTEGASAAAPPTSPVIFTVTKTGKLREMDITTEDGQRIIKCIEPDIQSTSFPGQTPVVSENTNGTDSYILNYSGSDFPECVWISASNFAGLAKVMGVDCLVFKATVKFRAKFGINYPTGERSPEGQAIAAIDLKTRLPVIQQIDYQTFVYQWEQPPQSTLVFPAVEQQALALMQKTLQRASMMPAAP